MRHPLEQLLGQQNSDKLSEEQIDTIILNPGKIVRMHIIQEAEEATSQLFAGLNAIRRMVDIFNAIEETDVESVKQIQEHTYRKNQLIESAQMATMALESFVDASVIPDEAPKWYKEHVESARKVLAEMKDELHESRTSHED
jgi:C4-type Zn-finger protein